MSEPFTPEIVHDLLKAAMKGAQRLPDVRGWKVRGLTVILNLKQQSVSYCRNQLPGEIKRANGIAIAIRILTEEAPKLRGEYVARLKLLASDIFERRYREDEAARARSNLEALDALVAAAQVVRERDLPLLPSEVHCPGIAGDAHRQALRDVPVEHWPEYAPSLVEAFQEFTGGSAEAGYRFVAAAAPRLTGESTTPGAVKIEVIRKQVQKETLAVPGTNATT
jgi:hypothetical protein